MSAPQLILIAPPFTPADPPTHNILPSFPWKPQQTFLCEEKLVHSGLEGAKNSDDQRSGDGRLLWGGRTERGLEISDL